MDKKRMIFIGIVPDEFVQGISDLLVSNILSTKEVSQQKNDICLMDSNEVAEFMAITEPEVMKLFKDGHLEGHLLGEKLRFVKSEVLDFIEERTIYPKKQENPDNHGR